MKHIQISWDDDAQTIICCTFIEGWTLDEFHEAYTQTGIMIRQSPNRVLGIIVDDSLNTTPPPKALVTFQRIFKEGTLPMAIIGGHHLTKMLLKIIGSSMQAKRQVLQANNLDEARKVLRESSEQPRDS